MVSVALVSETVLDRGALYNALHPMNEQNYATSVDANPGASRLEDDAQILRNFAGQRRGTPVEAILDVGILFGGAHHEISEIVEYTRGMPHLDCQEVPGMARVVLCKGSLDQWSLAIDKACDAHKMSVARNTFTKIFQLLCAKGFGTELSSYRTRETPGGILLLERK